MAVRATSGAGSAAATTATPGHRLATGALDNPVALPGPSEIDELRRAPVLRATPAGHSRPGSPGTGTATSPTTRQAAGHDEIHWKTRETPPRLADTPGPPLVSL
ncbi:hypothetical protein PSA01_65590 [Pseudonocardia saturnea]|uniref:Uncharacterized protein n=1 Tax=Pseudonocardia saturnea TaxID=33909 RepID=A0ABQ0S9C9_9PSEU|nr:hypothetical protein Pdca_50860 [Pseudonocardia autotrophica]GEC29530.1 hypothetical protein PSA01_65590 [Pseudonocardia saturnea]